MKDNIRYIIILLVSIFVFSATSHMDSRQYNISKEYKSSLSQYDQLPIYYGNRPDNSKSEDRMITLYDGIISYDLNPELIDQVGKISKVNKIYNYTALSFLNYSGEAKTEDCFETTIKINNQDIVLNDDNKSKKYIIAPYFLEDGLDDSLSKIFISTKLNDKLNCKVGDSLTISTIYIPTGLVKEEARYNHKKLECNRLCYSQNEKSFIIGGVVDYYNPMYNTDQIILVPYTMIETWIVENHDQSVEDYVYTNKVIYTDQSDIVSVTNQMAEISKFIEFANNHLYNYSKYTYETDLYKNIVIGLNIASVITFAGLYIFMKKQSNKDNILMIGTIFIGGILLHFILNSIVQSPFTYTCICMIVICIIAYGIQCLMNKQ